MWFVKTTRSGKRNELGELPPEKWTEGVVCPTLNSFDNGGESRATVLIIDGTRVGDVRISESNTMQTVISRWGTGGGNVPAIYPIQDGREVEKKQNGLGIGNETDPAYTLNSVDAQSVAFETKVRRLTPVECERLQGFPDNWTDVCSNSQRYKQMGNAVTVNVIEWIGKQIMEGQND